MHAWELSVLAEQFVNGLGREAGRFGVWRLTHEMGARAICASVMGRYVKLGVLGIKRIYIYGRTTCLLVLWPGILNDMRGDVHACVLGH